MKRIRMMGLGLIAILAMASLPTSSATAEIKLQGKSFTGYANREGSCKVAKPTAVAAGNQMLMQLYVEDPEGTGPFTISSPGWQLVEKVENKSSGIWFQLAVFTKKYEEGDPSEYSFSWTGTAKRGCGALGAAWSGVSKTEPINAHLGAPSAGASQTVRGPSITTTKPNCMIVMMGDYNSGDTRTPPPGMEEVAGPEGVMAQVLQAAAGATGDKDATTGKAEGNAGYLVALTPETPAPTVTSVSPNTGPQAGATPVTITGTNLSGASAVKFGSAAATNVTVNSPTSISATSPAGTGTVDVTVTTPGGTSATGSGDHFSYVPAPTVSAVSPASGPEAGATPVTITGTNLSGASAVKFGSAAATNVTVNSPTSISATSPAGTGTVDVTVTTPGGTSATGSGDHFSYVPAPTVSAVSPASGPEAGATPVTITGTNLSGASAVKFGSAAATNVTVNSPTSISATSPAGTGTVDVTVTTPGGTSATGSGDHFSYVPAPTVSAVSPASGPEAGATPVTITGTNLSGASAVKFGSAAATNVTVNSPTSISATSPAGTGTVDVTVTTPGGTSATGSGDHFSYVPAPTVSAVSPASGPEAGATPVTITGTNLSGASAVKFGSAAATNVTVNSPTSISATSPAGTGTVDVTVTTPGGTSATGSGDHFSYVPAPTVSAVSPASGPEAGATPVTITGTNLSGASAVKFGSAAATNVTVNSPTSISATSPAGTGTVDVTVTTPGGTSATGSGDHFSYVPAPTVSAVSPASGPEAGATPVTITGTNLSGASAVKFGSAAATNVTVNSPTSISATSPAGTGTVDVTVTTPGGTSATGSGDHFSYVAAPTVTTDPASSIGQSSATLNATVNPNGGTISLCHFDYGTSPSYGSDQPCGSLPSGSSPVELSARVMGLRPNTTYYFRVVAKNEAGTGYATELTFKTNAAEVPELGRCLKLSRPATGVFTTSVCTTVSTGEDSGKYEWQPWPAVGNHFSFKNGAATLETVRKSAVKCLENTLAGEYNGSQSAAVTMVFVGCDAPGALGGECQSEGASAGEIRSVALDGQLGFIKGGAKPSVGWDLSPASGQTVATFKCGATEISLAGSVIAPVTPVDKMSASFAVKFKASKGKQDPESFEAGSKDTLSFITTGGEEQAGLTASDTLVNEESLEIKAIV